MSISILYHTQNIMGYVYERTFYEGGACIFKLRPQDRLLKEHISSQKTSNSSSCKENHLSTICKHSTHRVTFHFRQYAVNVCALVNHIKVFLT